MKNILSIDGGGVKSYMPLRLLNEIEIRTKISISELFDYFAGVSAGALICSMLLIKNEEGVQKYSAAEIIQIFEVQCRQIFSYTNLQWVKSGFGLLDSAYSSLNISKSLDDYFINMSISELIKPLSIITFDLNTNKPIYFNRETFPSVQIKDCLMATTSAPTYFPPYSVSIDDHKYLFIDGGVVTNNPVEQCFLDAYNHFNCTKDVVNSFNIISLGTGYCEINYVSANYGKIGWAGKIIDILLNASMSEENYQLKIIDKFMSGNKLNRINFKLKKTINLDDITSFDIMKKIMDEWITSNDELINNLCSGLLENYSKIIVVPPQI
jgi:patatin-like phospholipase/acyl hydrolase